MSATIDSFVDSDGSDLAGEPPQDESAVEAAESAAATETTVSLAPQRDSVGKFLPGHVKLGGGWTPGVKSARQRYEAAIGSELERIAKAHVKLALSAKDERAQQAAAAYVTDQLIGKAVQRVEVDSPVLAELDDEFAAYRGQLKPSEYVEGEVRELP